MRRPRPAKSPRDSAVRWRLARWAFFAFLGATALVKGIGFGAVLILAVVAGVLLWQRDGVALRRLLFPGGLDPGGGTRLGLAALDGGAAR